MGLVWFLFVWVHYAAVVGARWLSGRVSDSGARGPGFETYLRRVCPWARHFTPRKYWLITQEAMAPSRHDWKIVDRDVKPQHNQLCSSRLKKKKKKLLRWDQGNGGIYVVNNLLESLQMNVNLGCIAGFGMVPKLVNFIQLRGLCCGPAISPQLQPRMAGHTNYWCIKLYA